MNVQVSQYFCPLVLCLLRWCCVFCCVVIGVMERSVLWGSSPHRCLLAFTSALLLCEIVIGRLCNSLINMVDSFHTLYILIHLTLLPLEKLTGVTVTSDPTTSTDPSQSEPQDPTTTTADGPTVTDSKPVPSSETTQPGHMTSGTVVSKADQYSLWRAQPFGAVLSALLLISLCISISLQVISSTLQALTIKRPLLATVIGAASLMFNSAILIWRGGRKMDVGVGARLSKDLIETQNENVAISNDTAKPHSQLRWRNSSRLKMSSDPDHSAPEDRLHNGVLMFCNPAVPSVLNPDQNSAHREDFSSSLSCTDLPSAPTTDSLQQSNHAQNSISHDAGDQQTLQLTETQNEEGNCTACIGQTGRSELVNCRPKRQQRRTCVKGTITVIRGLLSSVLVLANGLIFLLAGAGCLQPRSDCRYLRYLDPAFSVVTVLVLIGTTLPEFCRHALVLLQATPSHLRMEELTASIGQVPGVLAVHELHVWQLSGMHLVGSVHVHCPSGLRAVECSELLVTVTEVLNRFGVMDCTVQPEFITDPSDDPHCTGTGTEMRAGSGAGSVVPDTVDAAVQAHCSLQCGKECAKKMCCSPAQVRPCSRALSTADMLVKQQDIVLENPYL
ncbi:uncharacterized protein LOC111194732 [Astyanax mexicanus]|uniref:uncharacterized protein LOC111194732 n=1 Tax=Astyanax mexicanus TaxID=7994 RepID=UPI0020CB5917|nr:uncharacterized protein LOC111194732 [Astyanax mexicanus]